MEINPGFIPSSEHELVAKSLPLTVEVNSYRTRGEPVSINVSGVTSEWHSVKGGLGANANSKATQENYEILYEPILTPG